MKTSSSSSSPSRRRSCVAVFPAVIFFVLLIGVYTDNGLVEFRPGFLPWRNGSVADGNKALSLTHRKLLHYEAEKVSGNGTESVAQPNRIWSDNCSKSDIAISQGATEPLPSGIPTYTVEIINVCLSGCDISAIHLTCGWFSSARLINPSVFKRLGFNDCLVNGGKALASGRTLSFQYANTYPYSFSVSSLRC